MKNDSWITYIVRSVIAETFSLEILAGKFPKMRRQPIYILNFALLKNATKIIGYKYHGRLQCITTFCCYAHMHGLKSAIQKTQLSLYAEAKNNVQHGLAQLSSPQ